MKKTRNFKKVLSMVLTLVMVLSTMMIVPLTIHADAALQGDGSEATPYLVGSKADLEAVKAAITADDYGTAVYVKLTADIDMASAAFSLVDDATPVAPVPANPEADPPVEGVEGNAGSIQWKIDGAGYTISNTAAPLLVSSLGGIVIKNLNVVTAQDVATGDAAGLVALLKGTATIENCTVSGTIKATAGNAAGFVAVLDAGQTTGVVTFTGCKNDADVTASGHAAGFVAKVATGEPTINGGLNTGDIASTTDAADSAATASGFIGWIIDKKCDLATVKNAINLGKITAANNVNGAFVGHSKTGYVALENCFDNGEVVRNLFGADNTVALTVNNTATYEETLALIQAPKTAAAKLDKTANAWDGILVEEPALQNPAADNSAENPYLVGKASELAFFSYHADNIMDTNYWIKLTADINLGGKAWQGMVTARTEQLTVVVDGDGYTIYNGTMNTYLYGFFVGEDVGTAIKANLTVKNLHFAHMYGVGSLDSVKNETSASTAGMIAGGVAGDAVVSISNVTVDASCVLKTTAGTQKSGALIGGVEGNATVTIDKCAVSATLMGAGSATAYGGTTLNNVLSHGGFIGATTRPVTITNSITEVSRGLYVTTDGAFGMILGIATVEGSTFTNVFASGSSFTTSSCRYFDGKDPYRAYHYQPVNCYTRYMATQAGNAEAIGAICLAARGATEHIYDDACDETCACCGMTRVAPHAWENACDTTCECGATRTIEHTYDNDQDTTCNVCGATRTVTPPAADNTTNNTTNNTDTTTKAPADTTTAAADDDDDAKKKGCKKSIDSTYAVIALISVLGFAFVAKKREEN